jgi:nucleolar protein 53
LILAQRSAVSAVSLKAPQTRKKDRITKEEKERLLRIGKRKRSGPFNTATDTKEIGNGSALLEPSEAVKQAGTYDVWMEEASQSEEKSLVPKVMPPKVCCQFVFFVRFLTGTHSRASSHFGL